MRLYVIILAFTAYLLSSLGAFAQPAIGYAETKSLIANMTMMTYDRGHGTQVEYLGANGKTHLLYPGNTVIVKGSWKLVKTANPRVFDMCFRYPSNSYNPATGQTGGAWECRPAGFYLRDIVDRQSGDILGLAKRNDVPFVLAKRKTRLVDLVRLAGK